MMALLFLLTCSLLGTHYGVRGLYIPRERPIMYRPPTYGPPTGSPPTDRPPTVTPRFDLYKHGLELHSGLPVQHTVSPCPDGYNSMCDDMPNALRMSVGGLNHDECLRVKHCWDSVRNYCYFYNTTFDCLVEKTSLMEKCGGSEEEIDAVTCVRAGGCWQHGHGASSCQKRKLADRCEVSRHTNCNENDEENCTTSGCCWNADRDTCYKAASCSDRGPYTGACSKTCGIGWRVVTDGCGRLLCYEHCCQQPCNVSQGGNGNGGNPSIIAPSGSTQLTPQLCRDFQPYKNITRPERVTTPRPTPPDRVRPTPATVRPRVPSGNAPGPPGDLPQWNPWGGFPAGGYHQNYDEAELQRMGLA